MSAAVLGLRFALELAALGVLAWWGLALDAALAVRVLAGVGAPLAAAALWGAWVAPASRRRLADPARFVAESVVWVAATAALLALGHRVAALVFLVVALAVAALVRRYPEPVVRRG